MQNMNFPAVRGIGQDRGMSAAMPQTNQQGRGPMSRYTGPDARPAGGRRDGMRGSAFGMARLRSMLDGQGRQVPGFGNVNPGVGPIPRPTTPGLIQRPLPQQARAGMGGYGPGGRFGQRRPGAVAHDADPAAIAANPQGWEEFRRKAAAAGFNYAPDGRVISQQPSPQPTGGQGFLRQLIGGQRAPNASDATTGQEVFGPGGKFEIPGYGQGGVFPGQANGGVFPGGRPPQTGGPAPTPYPGSGIGQPGGGIMALRSMGGRMPMENQGY